MRTKAQVDDLSNFQNGLVYGFPKAPGELESQENYLWGYKYSVPRSLFGVSLLKQPETIAYSKILSLRLLKKNL